MEAQRPELLLAALARARSGAQPGDVVIFAKELESWIDAGESEADRGLRFTALMLAYQKFAPAGIESSLTDCAQVIYDYLCPIKAEPVPPSETETSEQLVPVVETVAEGEKPEAPMKAHRPQQGRQRRSGRAG